MDDRLPLGVTAVMLPELDFDEQIALCQRLGVTHYQLRPRIIPEPERGKAFSFWGNHKFDLTPRRLLAEGGEIRSRLSDAGLVAFGTVPGASVTDAEADLRLHFEGAAAAGAGRVRVAPPPLPAGPFNYASVLAQVIDAYGRAIELARPLGIRIVIETHARSLACSPGLAWSICRNFDPASIGVIFDFCNFASEGNVQPNLAVAVLQPFIDHLHVGGMQRFTASVDAAGFRVVESRMCALEESDLHFPTWLAALRDARVQVPLVIESFIAEVPGPTRLAQAVEAVKRAGNWQ